MRLKKWEWLIIAGIVALCFGIAYAVDEQITVINTTPSVLTAIKYTNAQSAIFYVEGNDIRVTMDGITTPTSGGVGMLLAKDKLYTDILKSNIDIKNFKAVAITATTSKISATYKWPQRVQ